MIGRHGSDRLSVFLLIIALVLTVFADLFKLTFLKYTSFLIMAIGIYRVLSKNTVKRRMENYKFVMLTTHIQSSFKNIQTRIKDSKTHRHFSCPSCKATLRLPKGKGKIMITCPKCRKEFSKKT
jgi:hypothetical protein